MAAPGWLLFPASDFQENQAADDEYHQRNGNDRFQFHKNHHADRSALGTNRDEREQTNGRLSCRIKFEEEAHYNAR